MKLLKLSGSRLKFVTLRKSWIIRLSVDQWLVMMWKSLIVLAELSFVLNVSWSLGIERLESSINCMNNNKLFTIFTQDPPGESHQDYFHSCLFTDVAHSRNVLGEGGTTTACKRECSHTGAFQRHMDFVQAHWQFKEQLISSQTAPGCLSSDMHLCWVMPWECQGCSACIKATEQ